MAEPPIQIPAVPATADHGRIATAILDFASQIPGSQVHRGLHPEAKAWELARQASRKAALTAGSLALPPGPLGWLTVLPELVAIWRIQAQMVSDIAAAYGQHASLGREQMLWCLFRHTAAQAFRDLVVRMGDRLLFRQLSATLAERVARRIGVSLSQRAVGAGISRWLPVVGAAGVGAYAWYDTRSVARTAMELFGSGSLIRTEPLDAADEPVGNEPIPGDTLEPDEPSPGR
jgi:uncharacterized protein (DUF697 family)